MKIVFSLFAVLAVIIAGALGWYYFDQSEYEVQVTTERPLFLNMKRFAISVDKDNHSRYLVMELSLKAHSPDAIIQFKEAEPLLNNILVDYFSGISYAKAKEALANLGPIRAALLEQFNACLEENRFEYKIEQVLLTNVFLQ